MRKFLDLKGAQQRRFPLAALLVVVLLGALGCGTRPPIGLVSERQGIVEHRGPGASTFQSIEANQPVFAGSGLRTGEESRATVTVTGIGELEFRADSFFEFSDDLSTVTQSKGFNRYTIKNQKDCFKIKTPHGVTSTVGTVFSFQVSPAQTELAVKEGSVGFTNSGTGKNVVLGPGQRVFATSNGFPGGIIALATPTTGIEPRLWSLPAAPPVTR